MVFLFNKELPIRYYLFLLSVCLLPSCATRQDVHLLNARISGLERAVSDDVSHELDSKLKSMRENQAEMVAELDQIRGEFQMLSGNAEEDRRLASQAIEGAVTNKERFNVLISDLESRIARLESWIKQIQSYLKLEPLTADETNSSVIPAPQTQTLQTENRDVATQAKNVQEPQNVLSPERELYELTLTRFKEEKYEEALSGFESFLKKFPRSDLADNAQFWVGECYMAIKQYERAILAYQDVIQLYPKGNKVPNAMLRQALAFNEIGDKTSLKTLLKNIIKKFPNSSEAKVAKIRLEKMK
jgi:tol-pal system protein YbgF